MRFSSIGRWEIRTTTGLRDDDMDIDTMITTYNTALTDAASVILEKERRRKKPWITKDVLDCDERKDLNKRLCRSCCCIIVLRPR